MVITSSNLPERSGVIFQARRRKNIFQVSRFFEKFREIFWGKSRLCISAKGTRFAWAFFA
jgi:hypothetical protein